MKLNIKLAFFAMLLCNISLVAQNSYTLTGTVTDGDDTTLIGVSVVKDGTTSGTVTDFDGMYKLDVSEGDVLRSSYTGHISETVNITDQRVLDVTLKGDATLLEEVVVVGYGTRKVSHNTGAIAQVGGEALAAVQVARVDEALAGKLSGVLIQNQDASPGAAPKIQIRAASSISGDANPLIVVDGFPISGSLATVNPNDIQSLEVLKDAASAAIYGSRGANGVILVTTKQGKTGKPSVSYNAYVSTSSRYINENKPVGNADWANTIEANVADGTFDISQIDPDLYNYRLNAYRNNPDVVAVEDWLFQNGNTVNHDLSISGGTDDVRYFASVGYLDIKGIVRDQGFERYNTRLNVDANLSDRFKAGLSFNGFIGDRDIEGHDQRDLLRAYSVHPIYHTAESIAFVQNLDQQAQALGLTGFDAGYRGGNSPFNNSIYTLEPGMTAQDWHYGRSGNGIGGSGDAGPATKLDNTDRFEKTFFGNVNSYLQYEIVKGLNVRTVLGGDMQDTRNYFWRGLEFDSRGRTTQTALDETNTKRTSVLSETAVNYATVLDGRHDISAVAGMEFQNFYIKGIALDGTNVPFGQPQNFGLLNPADVSISERDETIARRSVFGRVNYAFDNRYLLSFSLRRDGDSRFGENNRFQVFPAVSAGWNIHNEAFYNSEFLTDVKARFSYGSLGTTSFLGAYNSLSLLNPQATIFGNGFLIPSDVANPDLTWQTNTETNFGLNLGFLENRFRFAVDYYTSDVEDILINQSVSEVLGTTSIALNSGDVRSSGVELELGAALINTGDFRWELSANLSTVQTEITALGGLDELAPTIYGQSGRGPVFRNYIGGEIGEMWGIETTGEVPMSALNNPIEFVGQQSGYSFAVDQNGDGVIDRTRTVDEGGDLVKIGRNTPDFYYGFSSQLSYRSFDASFQFQGASGGDVYNIDPLYYGSQWGRSVQESFDAEGDGVADATGQIYVRNRDQTDAMIQSASYLALRNLTIGYTFNPNLKLVRVFGDVPLNLEATPSTTDQSILVRRSAEDIYNDVIIPDFQAAIDALDNSGLSNGRATRIAAQGFLGKVHVQRGDFNAAEAPLAAVINGAAGAGVMLQENYEDVFGVENDLNSEILFATQVSASIVDEYGFSEFWSWYGGLDTKSLEPLDSDLIDAFGGMDSEDLRFPVVVDTTTFTASAKYPQEGGPDHDWIELRLADVILLYAETLNENGADASTVLDLIAPIRERAGLDNLNLSSQSDIRTAIQDERRLELAFEGQRWFDLVRTNTVSEEMGVNVNSNFFLFPIPVSEILSSFNVITQNDGY